MDIVHITRPDYIVLRNVLVIVSLEVFHEQLVMSDLTSKLTSFNSMFCSLVITSVVIDR